MRNYLIVLCFVLVSSSTNAQTDSYSQLKSTFDVLRNEQKHDSALILAKEMSHWALKNESDTSLRYAVSCRHIGTCFLSLQKYDSAFYYWNASLFALEKQHRTIHPDYASSLNNSGLLYRMLGDYYEAEKRCLMALDIRSKTIGEEHSEYAANLNNLGIINDEMGNYKEAEMYYKKALEKRKKTVGEEHYNYYSTLNNLGNLYRSMGDFKTSEQLLKQVVEILKKSIGEEHVGNVAVLNNLGLLYAEIGDYKAAEQLYAKAIDITKKNFGEDNNYAKVLNNLALLENQIGEYGGVEQHFKKVLEIREKNLGNKHPDYASGLNNLGLYYYNIGDYSNAEKIYTQCLEIRKKTLGEEHTDYATSLNNLGLLYYKMGNYNSAIPLSKQALEIRKNVFGEEHPIYISTEVRLAYMFNKSNNEQMAYELLKKNFSNKSKQIVDNFEWFNDIQKEFYWKQESVFYDNLSWFANERFETVPESVGLNYNAALINKSKLLETKISSENYYLEVDQLREELAYRRRLITKMESDGIVDKSRIEKLRHEADSLDKRLTISWPEYAQQKKNLSITWNRVQENLLPGEVAIEFVRFKNENDSLFYYNALILRKEDKLPQLVQLCKEAELQNIPSTHGFSEYYPLLWKPLENYVKDANTIYYAPVGILYNVPFHAIYERKSEQDEVTTAPSTKRGVVSPSKNARTEENVEYLMDKYLLHQLTSTRYLAMGIKQKEKEPISKSVIMVGGVNYDYLPGTFTESTKNKKDKHANRSSESASGKLNFLNGTKIEVEKINSTVNSSNWLTQVLDQNQATEENVIKIEGKDAKGIMHIATHGYAFPEFDFKDTSISKNSIRYNYRWSQNPMVRSGLILAGGNWAWTGSDTLTKLGAEENGILTALEVSQLNLRKTKLVVLSACETGLGSIEGAEGTFGLKRGFKLAGVEQMIVSLWSVPDQETMELMTLFYGDLIKTQNPISAFEKAQKEMRHKYPTEPDKWAGFVLVR